MEKPISSQICMDTLHDSTHEKPIIASTLLLGTALITCCSFIKIPLYPVPFTLQTFAIYILALTQTPRQAFASTFFYLLGATIGLPVFGGHANPTWILGKCSGYLIAFPIAAFCIAKIRLKRSAFQALLCGMLVIFFLGLLRLIPIVGLQTAFMKGVLIFLPSEIFKILAAIQLIHRRNHD